MSLSIDQAGKPITAGEAQKYITEYLLEKKTLIDKVLARLTLGEIKSDKDLKNCVAHFDSEENAFIFSRDMLDRFFNPQDQAAPKANYLIIFLGAKYKDDAEKGQRTVVIAGANEHPTKANTLVSLNIPAPAGEQPPKKVIATFPVEKISDNFGDIEFKIL